MSAQTLEYHHGKHHMAYVNQLNALQLGSVYEAMTLEQIIRSASGPIYNNAAQAWNHDFFWRCMVPGGGGRPAPEMAAAIATRWGDFDTFRTAFIKAAVSNFGSGWTWLVLKPDGRLDIENAGPAGTPLTGSNIPLLVIDVWEHAYYIDYRNQRQKFVENFLDHLVNWSFAAENFERGSTVLPGRPADALRRTAP